MSVRLRTKWLRVRIPLLSLRIINPFWIIIGLINTNSITNKFDQFWNIIQNDLNTLMISETKTDNKFPEPRFSRKGYSRPFRLDFPSKMIKTGRITNYERFFYWNQPMQRKKWLLVCSHNHHKNYVAAYLETISKALDNSNTTKNNIILMNNLSAELGEIHMAEFLSIYNLK